MRSCFRLLPLFALLVLGACAVAAPEPDFDDIRFTAGPAIRLDVARIEIVERYRPTLAKPNVEHRFPVTPSAALRNWVNDRLLAVGGTGTATVFIEDASVLETELKRKRGLSGLFKDEQAERYDGRMKVVLKIVAGDGNSLATVEAVTTRMETVPESITLNERQVFFHRFTLELAADLDRTITVEIHRHMADFIK